MNKVGIIDYGSGNIASVEKSLEYAGASSYRIKRPEEIFIADRIILPGVGAAGEALMELKERNLVEPLAEVVFKRGVPFLGICLGMQLLADELNEFGQHKGLGWIPGRVIHIKELIKHPYRIPHIGWNLVRFRHNAKELSKKLNDKSYFYFAHSYTFCLDNSEMIAATVNYGVELVAAIKYENIFATQFHPEKSQVVGENLIQSFLEWKP